MTDRMDAEDSGPPARTRPPAGLRILVVEDEAGIVEFLRAGLAYEGHEVTVALDGRTAIALAEEQTFDVALLDLMLPELEGREVCRALRETTDKIAGLDAGADDYLTKPFSFDELLARMRAVLRRRGQAQPAVIQIGGLSIDLDAREALSEGAPLDLTPIEFSLLALFMRHPRRVFSRQTLVNRVWGFDYVGDTNAVDVHISNLRRKLGTTHRAWIRTVYGVGYCLRTDDGAAQAAM